MIVDEETRAEHPGDQNINGIVLVTSENEEHAGDGHDPADEVKEMVRAWRI